ncbi:hypothetical protein HZH68_010361 [Vespula germanica]|uniref:Uncharacterized protein n=1 Tax=Vespula germanica TaxID=30212 RepID=A0A834N229_VESGE|nr:hypothetical protein HZH68_010361 [Vespula germanica]
MASGTDANTNGKRANLRRNSLLVREERFVEEVMESWAEALSLNDPARLSESSALRPQAVAKGLMGSP